MTYIIYLIVIVSIIVFGITKGISDGLAHSTDENIYTEKWFSNNWRNKYTITWKHGIPCLNDYKKKWYYFGIHTPEHEEKFPFSSTILSFRTDAWHFFNFIRYKVIYSNIVLLLHLNILWSLLAIFIIFPIIVGFSFEQTYKRI